MLAPLTYMGTTLSIEGVEIFISFVHGSKMVLGKVKFLAAVAWVKGGGGERGVIE